MLFLPLLLLAAATNTVEWPAYGNDPGGARYSEASQITTSNVIKLKVAWTYATRDMHNPGPNGRGRPSALETTPLYADETLYLTSGWGRVIALDPETAQEKWSYDPKIDPSAGWGDFTNRGVALHRKGGRTTIIGVAIDARLFALDARDGKRIWEADLGSESAGRAAHSFKGILRLRGDVSALRGRRCGGGGFRGGR